jgi:hypothetical protein
MPEFRFIVCIVLRYVCFYTKITQIRGPKELIQPKIVHFGGSWTLLFNNKVNVKTQELNVNLLLLEYTGALGGV